jgi:cytochrome c-type biogenesis protein
VVDAPTLTLAFAAGFVSFVSPCCLPLVPGYLATVSGMQPSDLSRGFRASAMARSLLFVATFSLIFVLLGLAATVAGAFLADRDAALNTLAGLAIVAMGTLFVASVFIVRLNGDFRLDALVQRAGHGGPIVAGAAFALAWTPCVGPTLGAILGLAATSQGTAQGAALLTVYSAGLAVPFLLTTVAFQSAMRGLVFFKRNYAAIQVSAGVLLIATGVLVLTGELFRLNVAAQQLLDRFGLNLFQGV